MPLTTGGTALRTLIDESGSGILARTTGTDVELRHTSGATLARGECKGLKLVARVALRPDGRSVTVTSPLSEVARWDFVDAGPIPYEEGQTVIVYRDSAGNPV